MLQSSGVCVLFLCCFLYKVDTPICMFFDSGAENRCERVTVFVIKIKKISGVDIAFE